MEKLERHYDATAEEVWDLWTTSDGIEAWWAPDGFEVKVRTLDLRPGGDLVYDMTATAPEQVEFMKNNGMPLTNQSRKTFTQIQPPSRLAYISVIDFVPGVEPYDQRTVIDLEPRADGVDVVMTVEAMHDAEWTQRLVAGRSNELDNLTKVIAEKR